MNPKFFLALLTGGMVIGSFGCVDDPDSVAAAELQSIEQVIHSSISWALTKNKPLLDSCFTHEPDLFIYHPNSFDPWIGHEPLERAADGIWMTDDFRATGFNMRDLRLNLARSGEVAWFSAVMDDIGEWKGQPMAWMNTRWTGVLEKREGHWVIVQEHLSFAPSMEGTQGNG